MKKYDYLIVGAGLFGAVCAYKAKQNGFKCLVIEKRDHIGGNCYTETIKGINVHKYGAHIFHTSNKEVWDFVNSLVSFNQYINSPIANYKGELYNLPFNMNTFYQLWGIQTPREAKHMIDEQRAAYKYITDPQNLEEQALFLCGQDIYNKLIKGYSEKQWGRKATEIPSFVIKRIPLRYTFNNNYFNDPYQGIPIGGYTSLFKKLLEGIEVHLNTDFLAYKNEFIDIADKIVYTGPIDAFYNFCFGNLSYRSLKFENIILEKLENYQGNAVFNYTSADIPYTRIIEHKHFEFGTQPDTIITKEYSVEWDTEKEPYYSVNDKTNNCLFLKYKALADMESNIYFGGRLAEYKYYDMDKVVEKALKMHL